MRRIVSFRVERSFRAIDVGPEKAVYRTCSRVAGDATKSDGLLGKISEAHSSKLILPRLRNHLR